MRSASLKLRAENKKDNSPDTSYSTVAGLLTFSSICWCIELLTLHQHLVHCGDAYCVPPEVFLKSWQRYTPQHISAYFAYMYQVSIDYELEIKTEFIQCSAPSTGP